MEADTNEEMPSLSKDDFDKLHEALRDSSARHSRLLMTFVLALLYLLITVASTTDLQLLLPDSRVALPVLNVELPLIGFFWFAPALVLILHFTFLLHLLHHAAKLKAWAKAASDERKVLVPVFILNYTESFLPKTIHHQIMRLLQVVVIGFAPLLLLWYIQYRFADYHSLPMTTWHFVVVCLDVIVLFIYWVRTTPLDFRDKAVIAISRVLFGVHRTSGNWFKHLWTVTRILISRHGWREASVNYMRMYALVVLASAACLVIVLMVTCDYFDAHHWYIPRLNVQGQVLVTSPPSDVILSAYIAKGWGADSAWADYAEGIDLRGRDLRFADLSGCNLFKARLQSSRLNNTWLIGAELNRAELDSAKLNGADLGNVELNGAVLGFAELEGAYLDSAMMNDASLAYAVLNGAHLCWAQLNGAALGYAELNGTELRWAEMNGANLHRAELNGASLILARLNGADLTSAGLNGAFLNLAKLNGADLTMAQLNGSHLLYTQLNGACLRSAQLNGAILDGAGLKGANLEQIRLGGCQRIASAATDSVVFVTRIDTVFTPNWDSLTADSIKIPPGERRQAFVNSLRSSRAYNNDSLKASLEELNSDSAGFKEFRKRLACDNTWVALGLVRQEVFLKTPLGKLGESVVVHMLSICPDSLDVALAQMETHIRSFGLVYSARMSAYMREKAARDST